jgi:hypothetical protein
VLARLGSDPSAAAAEPEALVAETVALVEAHLPDVDVTDAKRSLGERQTPWPLPPGAEAAAAQPPVLAPEHDQAPGALGVPLRHQPLKRGA